MLFTMSPSPGGDNRVSLCSSASRAEFGDQPGQGTEGETGQPPHCLGAQPLLGALRGRFQQHLGNNAGRLRLPRLPKPLAMAEDTLAHSALGQEGRPCSMGWGSGERRHSRAPLWGTGDEAFILEPVCVCSLGIREWGKSQDLRGTQNLSYVKFGLLWEGRWGGGCALGLGRVLEVP